MKTAWKHQEEARAKARQLWNYALFFEMGTGKSRTLIDILRDNFNEAGRIQRTIIFCPPLVVPNWKREWLEYSKVPPSRIILLQGSSKKRLADFLANSGEPTIFITNYESLLMKDLFLAFQLWKPENIVEDESHKLKNPSAQRSKLADQLANPFDKPNRKPFPKPHTYLLSGSPILNSPMDIFMQFKIMDGGRTFGHNFFAFRAKYFRDRNATMPKQKYFPKWEIMTLEKDNKDSIGEINDLIFSQAMRVEKKDCLDLPPEVSVTMKVGMSRDQARLYHEMKNEFVTYYESKACIATLAITKALRLMQIASGFVSVETPGEDDGPVLYALENIPKVDALKDLLEELIEQGHKVLIWAVFRQNYGIIRGVVEEVLKKHDEKFYYVEAHGDIPAAQKRDVDKTFQNDENCRVFIGHPGSGGIGINLTAAAYSIFYSRTFSMEHYLQSRARNHRGGATEQGHTAITHYDLVCEGTIEEKVIQALASKQKISDKLLNDFATES